MKFRQAFCVSAMTIAAVTMITCGADSQPVKLERLDKSLDKLAAVSANQVVTVVEGSHP